MSKKLYISVNLSKNNYGGSVVGRTNFRLFKEIFGDEACAIAVNRNPLEGVISVRTSTNRVGTAIANIFGICATLTRQGALEIIDFVRKERPSIIWLDTSLLGHLIPQLRIESPGVKIICFFHNLEEDMILEKIRKGQWVYYIALLATRTNERMSAKLADIVVTIQKTDAEKLLARHGRKSEFTLPVCIPDTYSQVMPSNPYPGVRYVLFVGSDFPPNVEALQYLSREVSPSLKKTIVIAVGNGLEKYVPTLSHDKMIIKGYVEDLDAIYYHAIAVVTPIFSGGGMKVKVAEALMQRKYVVGSRFSFIGYQSAVDFGVCIVANSVHDYVASIESSYPSSGLNLLTQEVFTQEYSLNAGAARMEKIIDSVKTNLS